MTEKVRHYDIEKMIEGYVQESPPGAFMLNLRGLSQTLIEEGFSREELIEVYEHFRESLQERELEDLEDELLDVMSQLEGYCAPHVAL